MTEILPTATASAQEKPAHTQSGADGDLPELPRSGQACSGQARSGRAHSGQARSGQARELDREQLRELVRGASH